VNASEARGDLTLIQTPLLFSFKCQLVSIRTTWFTHTAVRSLSNQGHLQPHWADNCKMVYCLKKQPICLFFWAKSYSKSVNEFLVISLIRVYLLTEKLTKKRTKLPYRPRIPEHAYPWLPKLGKRRVARSGGPRVSKQLVLVNRQWRATQLKYFVIVVLLKGRSVRSRN